MMSRAAFLEFPGTASPARDRQKVLDNHTEVLGTRLCLCYPHACLAFPFILEVFQLKSWACTKAMLRNLQTMQATPYKYHEHKLYGPTLRSFKV